MAERKILNGWKAIANYMGLAVRTVQRYEAELMLPVRRPAQKRRSTVIAFSDEINAWLSMAGTQAHAPSIHGEAGNGVSQPSPVIVVEDREEDVECAKLCLSQAGFNQVVVFHSPGPAIGFLQSSCDGEQPLPRGILLDLLLHQDNGFEVLRFCHSQPRLHGIPVVVWTQLLGPTEKEIAHWLGARKFLNKGLAQQRMIDHLRTAFSDSECSVHSDVRCESVLPDQKYKNGTKNDKSL